MTRLFPRPFDREDVKRWLKKSATRRRRGSIRDDLSLSPSNQKLRDWYWAQCWQEDYKGNYCN